MKALLPTILLFSLVAPAKAFTCGEFAENYLVFAKPIGDPTRSWQASGFFIGHVYGFDAGEVPRKRRPATTEVKRFISLDFG